MFGKKKKRYIVKVPVDHVSPEDIRDYLDKSRDILVEFFGKGNVLCVPKKIDKSDYEFIPVD